MRIFILAFLALLVAPFAVQAQQVQAVTVATCGTPPNTPVVGNAYTITMDTTGKLCSNNGAVGGAVAPYVGTPLGFQQITSLGASTALTVPGGATFATITVETAPVRWRDDGVAPTSSVGYLMTVGQSLFYSSGLANIRFIQTSAGAVLDISYYR